MVLSSQNIPKITELYQLLLSTYCPSLTYLFYHPLCYFSPEHTKNYPPPPLSFSLPFLNSASTKICIFCPSVLSPWGPKRLSRQPVASQSWGCLTVASRIINMCRVGGEDTRGEGEERTGRRARKRLDRKHREGEDRREERESSPEQSVMAQLNSLFLLQFLHMLRDRNIGRGLESALLLSKCFPRLSRSDKNP